MDKVIFKQEIEDGLEDLIKNDKATCSFDIELCDKFEIKEDIDAPKPLEMGVASVGDPDLFYFKAIHASTGLNLNHHYFLPEELWNARKTAAHKRINFEHEEANIIGADLQSYAVDFAGNIINDDSPLHNIPDKFDIHTKGVLYRVWTDKAKQHFMDDLISKVQAGQYSVSMEAFFPHWDYVLIDSAGKEEFIQRNSKTSYLSKHMKKFGGSGKYDGKVIGQVLRNIVFGGKGIVKKPANPRSQILEVEENSQKITVGEKISDSLVYSNTEGNNTMTVTLEKDRLEQLEKFEKELATVTEAKEKLATKVDELNKQVSELALANTELNKVLSESKTELETVKASLTEVNGIVETYKFKEAQLVRVKTVKDSLNYEDQEASDLVSKFEKFNDDQFNLVLASIPKKAKVETKTITVKDLTKKAEASLDEVKPEENINVNALTEKTVTKKNTVLEEIDNFLSKKK